MLNRKEHNFFISPTDKFEIVNIVSNISPNKACGLPSNIIHLNISEPLAQIINLSFEKGTQFENLKISNNIPTFKEKGSNQECINYRPIPNTIPTFKEKGSNQECINYRPIPNTIPNKGSNQECINYRPIPNTIPTFKEKGSNQECINYRPIPNTIPTFKEKGSNQECIIDQFPILFRHLKKKEATKNVL